MPCNDYLRHGATGSRHGASFQASNWQDRQGGIALTTRALSASRSRLASSSFFASASRALKLFFFFFLPWPASAPPPRAGASSSSPSSPPSAALLGVLGRDDAPGCCRLLIHQHLFQCVSADATRKLGNAAWDRLWRASEAPGQPPAAALAAGESRRAGRARPPPPSPWLHSRRQAPACS